jgi:hypothetical protein
MIDLYRNNSRSSTVTGAALFLIFIKNNYYLVKINARAFFVIPTSFKR